MKTTRRDFLKNTGFALGSAALLSLSGCVKKETAEKAVRSFGFQVWTIRKELVEDFAGTLKKMAGFGYKEVEMCSPLGYSESGFEPLNNMSGADMRKIIEDAGLICSSSHFNLGELRDSLDNRIEWAQGLGMKQMILSSFWLPRDTATIDDYRKSAEELNIIAEKTKAAGIQMGFHNHHMEFQKQGEELIYDALMDTLDPELVKMQFQVAVVNIGYNAADYFRKYPGRFISAHLADWSKETDQQVPIGQGDVDWVDFFSAAETGGVKNFFVEMSPEKFAPSAEFLLNM
ncbi:sugar phosphate isomerase/epimerase [candidate division KSB1 bacterium]|nr:sugar phosphate isomerase/epimerase [candidate division KSB1 bacterium]